MERRRIALYWPPCVPPAVRCQSQCTTRAPFRPFARVSDFGNESSALGVDLNVASFKAAFYGRAAMYLRFSSAFYLAGSNLFTFRQVQGQVPHLAPQYGYSIPYNESEHGGQINPAPPPLWCAEDTISPLCVQWH